MNVAIIERATKDVIARYEIHKAGEAPPPADDAYFDEAWQRAVRERLVDVERRGDYEFQMQRPKTLYESSV
jgi:hypothetical protein